MTWRHKSKLLAFFLIGSALSALSSKAFAPDHYQSYSVRARYYYRPHNVFLKDQFLGGEFQVHQPLKLLNPSNKIHLFADGSQVEVGINNPKLHYVAYGLTTDSPNHQTKTVRIKNQFEDATLTVVTLPDRLLTPASKWHYNQNTDSAEQDADGQGDIGDLHIPDGSHYLCYPIEEKEVFGLGVLKDQFGSRYFQTLKRTHLCNPAIKRHNNKVYETDIFDGENHLVCYAIESVLAFRNVFTFDQFGLKKLIAFKNNEVCVPTYKEAFDPNPIFCGEQGEDGQCPTAPNCPADTFCRADTTVGGSCFCL